MVPRTLPRTAWLLALALATGVILVPSRAADPPEKGAFTPVAPRSGVEAGLQSALKTLRGWLDDKDYLSAVQSTGELDALLQLYGYYGKDSAWQERVAALRTVHGKLTSAIRAKDKAACESHFETFRKGLTEAVRVASTGEAMTEKNFRPVGGLKTWMGLMDGAHADAKTAKSAAEMRDLAYAIAEEANAVAQLRGDARWRQLSADVRDAALATAGKADGDDLAPAKAELKKVFKGCEACHQGYKR
jgi:hypothetical protein